MGRLPSSEAAVGPITLPEIEAAAERIRGVALRTPLLSLGVGGDDGSAEIYAKLENLQPIGSFKLRGAANAIAQLDDRQLEQGVYTASAGNMAQGVAWNARRLGVPCTVIVPDHAPRAKLDPVERLGARIIPVPFERWWQVLEEGGYPDVPGHFIHPFRDPAVIAGNGTIGLEILEDLPETATVIVPYGGGGLISGIGSAVKARRPNTRLLAAEVETGAPVAGSLAAGAPAEASYTPSWVDGIASRRVLPAMWPLVSSLIDGSVVVSLQQVAQALRFLVARARVIAEGAGAASIAAALAEAGSGAGPIVAVVSGGNIDAPVLADVLSGRL